MTTRVEITLSVSTELQKSRGATREEKKAIA